MQRIGNTIWIFIEKVVEFVLKKFFKITDKDISENTLKNFMQFTKFGIVGVSNTLIYYVLYIVSILILRKFALFGAIDYLVAQIIAFILSVLWSFYWNNKVVFKIEEGEHRNLWKALLKTYVSYSFNGLFLSSALLVLWVDVLYISEFWAPIINLLISVPVNFLINKFWAFKQFMLKEM